MEQQEISVEYIDHMGSDMHVCNMARQSFGKWKNESLELDIVTGKQIGRAHV